MKLLVVGGGGREHAICAALRRENPDAEIFCAPGNPGTESFVTNLPIAADDIEALVRAAAQHDIDLTIVGPEQPLALGLADRLQADGRRVFGPTAAAAQIEASKAFAKDVMAAAWVPTAASRTFQAVADALAYVATHAEPLVVKASGLAAGKGAVVCATRSEAADAVRAMFSGSLGEAGHEVLVESFLEGEELSVFAICNGHDVALLPSAQDHKRIFEGDNGPNTGGMGAYSPVSLATAALLGRATREVLLPTLAEMERRGAAFRGILYAGLMIAPDGSLSVVEFNCRLGDPETQVVLPLVSDGFTAACWAAAEGAALPDVSVARDSAVTTVLAAHGYPDTPKKGAAITIPDDLDSRVTVYHAGTRRDADGTLQVNGGRVLAVTAMAPTFSEAQRLSREAAEQISFEGKQFRRDIGWREAARLDGV
ncbi:MAG: phosphoribosylamine--glycine ligase [Gemmatimonadota bacterium]|nr:phosphoribosylamine--glycine ligase [Gemmatimonadota bacterium]